jgi:NDP-sugar pyrophosphorylase family protein
MEKRAIILAGGKGTRLRPYTIVLPKPLLPIGDYPVLEIIIRQLVWFGFTRITLTVNHQAEIIKAFFGDGSRWGIDIDYSFEDKPLSTMGPLRLIPDLPEQFLIMNGDVLTDLNFEQFFRFHGEHGCPFTISAFNRSEISEFGVLETNPEQELSAFVEKPKRDYLVSMGIYMASREILSMIPDGIPFGFDQLMLKMLDKQEPVSVRRFEGYWLDMGRPDDYQQAIDDVEKLKKNFMPWE